MPQETGKATDGSRLAPAAHGMRKSTIIAKSEINLDPEQFRASASTVSQAQRSVAPGYGTQLRGIRQSHTRGYAQRRLS